MAAYRHVHGRDFARSYSIRPHPTWDVGGRRRVQVVAHDGFGRVIAQHLTTFAGRVHVLHGIHRPALRGPLAGDPRVYARGLRWRR